MRKINNYTLEQIQKNLLSFNKKITDKSLNINFWIIADRADFKPLNKTTIVNKKEIKTNIHSIKELRDNILDKKGEYYKDKKFADIKILIDNEILEKVNDIKEYKNIKNKPILFVHIKIYLINLEGNINFTDKWELNVKYVVDDFRTLKFKLKNIEVLMRLVADSVITTSSINGISYKNLLTKINNKDNNIDNTKDNNTYNNITDTNTTDNTKDKKKNKKKNNKKSKK